MHLRSKYGASHRFRQPLALQDVVIPQHTRRTTVFEVDEAAGGCSSAVLLKFSGGRIRYIYTSRRMPIYSLLKNKLS